MEQTLNKLKPENKNSKKIYVIITMTNLSNIEKKKFYKSFIIFVIFLERQIFFRIYCSLIHLYVDIFYN